jgi:predicted short-subunit dehydrogenase-like oxidoreductase (DUF2520 family)
VNNSAVSSSGSLTLSCIGGGRLGSTLCRLFAEQQTLDIAIGQLLNRHLESASHAVRFIGQGEAVATMNQLKPADLWLIATPDDKIETVSRALAETMLLRPGDMVFHCSGSLNSEVLSLPQDQSQSAAEKACLRASVHPIHSFADPAKSVSSFAGSSCAVEGEAAASDYVTRLFSAIGGNCFALRSDKKTLYHAATVMACNNLVALLASSKQMLAAADIAADQQDAILNPLIRQTVDNYLYHSDARAVLTGPISRGDSDTVAAHLRAIADSDQTQAASWQSVYAALGEVAVEIARQQAYASEDKLDNITQLLANSANTSD